MLEQPMVDIAVAEAFAERRTENARVVRWLTRYLASALAALVVEAVGLDIAAAPTRT